MAQAPFDENEYKTDLGISTLWGEKGYKTNERTGIRPTLEVNGIWGGYTGEGAKTVDISEFQVATPRAYRLHRDQVIGEEDTLVYPVRVKYTTKEFHTDLNKVVSDREQIYVCSVSVDHWTCGPDQVLKQGDKKQIQVKKE